MTDGRYRALGAVHNGYKAALVTDFERDALVADGLATCTDGRYRLTGRKARSGEMLRRSRALKGRSLMELLR